MEAQEIRDIRTAWQQFAEHVALPVNMDQTDAYWLFTQGAQIGIAVMANRFADVANDIAKNPEKVVAFLHEMGVAVKAVADDAIAEADRATVNRRNGS